MDKHGRVFAVLAGRPDQEEFLHSANQAYNKITSLWNETDQKPEMNPHRRGQFPVMNIGINHGQGPTEPYRLNQSNAAKELLEAKLLSDPDIKRLALFQPCQYCICIMNCYITNCQSV